jgi:hypothetical protein
MLGKASNLVGMDAAARHTNPALTQTVHVSKRVGGTRAADAVDSLIGPPFTYRNESECAGFVWCRRLPHFIRSAVFRD